MNKAGHQTDSQEEGVNETEQRTTALPSLSMMESGNCPSNNDSAIVTKEKFCQLENQIALIKSELTVVRRKEDEMLAILHKLEQQVSFLVPCVDVKMQPNVLFTLPSPAKSESELLAFLEIDNLVKMLNCKHSILLIFYKKKAQLVIYVIHLCLANIDVAVAEYTSNGFAGIIIDGKHKKDFPQTVREGLGLQIFTNRAW